MSHLTAIGKLEAIIQSLDISSTYKERISEEVICLLERDIVPFDVLYSSESVTIKTLDIDILVKP